MAKPPPATPNSDLDGVNQDARAGSPGSDPALGSSKEAGEAEEGSKARPERSNERN